MASRMGTHGRTTFKLPVKGRTAGNGMKRGKRSMLPKHRTHNRSGGR